MAFDVGAGLAEAGKSVAQTAQAYTLESQKAELEQQKLVLANQMTGERESAGRKEQGLINAAAAEKEQGFKASEGLANRTSEEKRTAMSTQASMASAGAAASASRYHADKQLEATRLTLEQGKVPPEAAFVKWLTDPATTPEQREKGMDLWKGRHDKKLPEGYRDAPGGLEAIPGGPADPSILEKNASAKRAVNEKAIPASVTKGMQENLTAVRKIDQTLAELNNLPGSVGGAGSILSANIPGVSNLQNRDWFGGDPSGTKLRALVSDIGSLKIHDRSGAAVTASEMPRLKPFIPSISDDPETVRKKLANFRAEYDQTLQDTLGYYNRDNGFHPYTPAEDYLRTGRVPPQGEPAAKPPATPEAKSIPLKADGTPDAGGMVRGTIYNTTRGLGRWNGTNFEPVQ